MFALTTFRNIKNQKLKKKKEKVKKKNNDKKYEENICVEKRVDILTVTKYIRCKLVCIKISI